MPSNLVAPFTVTYCNVLTILTTQRTCPHLVRMSALRQSDRKKAKQSNPREMLGTTLARLALSPGDCHCHRIRCTTNFCLWCRPDADGSEFFPLQHRAIDALKVNNCCHTQKQTTLCALSHFRIHACCCAHTMGARLPVHRHWTDWPLPGVLRETRWKTRCSDAVLRGGSRTAARTSLFALPCPSCARRTPSCAGHGVWRTTAAPPPRRLLCCTQVNHGAAVRRAGALDSSASNRNIPGEGRGMVPTIY